MYVLARKGTLTYNIKNWKAPHVPYVERIFFTYRRLLNDPWDNSYPITQEQLDQMITISKNIDQHTKSASGRERLPVVYSFISAQTDSVAQKAIARGWDYSSLSYRRYGTPPTNHIVIDTQNWRIKYGVAGYDPITNSGALFDEEFEKTVGAGNDPNSITSSAYTGIINSEGIVEANILGITMIAVSTMSNPWTPVQDLSFFNESRIVIVLSPGIPEDTTKR